MARLAALVVVIVGLGVVGLAVLASNDSDEASSVAVAAETAVPASEPADAPEPTPTVVFETPPVLGPEIELYGLDGWLQSDIDELADLRGTVHVVQFWTFGCYNCKNTLDNLGALYERHADDNFEVVGVHTPEFDYEKDPERILEASESLGVTWPIALDTNKTNFREWQGSRRFWPRTYVIDQNGDIRFDRIGEGAYKKLNDTVAWLLENPPEPNAPDATETSS